MEFNNTNTRCPNYLLPTRDRVNLEDIYVSKVRPSFRHNFRSERLLSYIGSERHPQGQNTESDEDKRFRIRIIQQIEAPTLRNRIISDVKGNGRKKRSLFIDKTTAAASARTSASIATAATLATAQPLDNECH